jgi:hypothetical protein
MKRAFELLLSLVALGVLLSAEAVPPRRGSHDGYAGGKHWLEYLTAFFALVAALGSVSAVIVGAWQWSSMDESNIANTRAWISPTGARFDGDPKAGSNVRVKIAYENVGKEAASDVVGFGEWSDKIYDVTIDDKQMPYIDIQTNPWPTDNKWCRVDPSMISNRRTVYPGAKNEIITYGFNNNTLPFLPQEVIDGKKFFWIYGCFVYRSPITKKKIHHSPFCLYYQPKRDGTIKDATFEFCPSGSANAD